MRRRNKSKFRFAPLQGRTAARLLKFPAGETWDSIIYLRQDRLYDQSDALLYIANDLGGAWKLMWIFAIIPRFIRNYFYRIIARNRYRWFGKSESCRLPSPGDSALFLD